MNTYMFTITVPEFKDNEFLALIPSQREHIDALIGKGTVSTYALSADHTKLWVTVNAESIDEAKHIIDAFPLRKFMAVEVTELAFSNTPAARFPALSMN